MQGLHRNAFCHKTLRYSVRNGQLAAKSIR